MPPVFIAVVLTIARTWKQLNVPLTEGMDKDDMAHTHTHNVGVLSHSGMEYHLLGVSMDLGITIE